MIIILKFSVLKQRVMLFYFRLILLFLKKSIQFITFYN